MAKLYRLSYSVVEKVERYRDKVKYHVDVTALEELERGNDKRYEAIINKAEKVLPELDSLLGSIHGTPGYIQAEWKVISKLKEYAVIYDNKCRR